MYIPDFFRGQAAPTSVLEGVPFDFMKWGALFPRDETLAAIENFCQHLYKEEGVRVVMTTCRINNVKVTSLAAAGFCWGGRYSILLTRNGLIKGGLAAHPSFLMVDIPTYLP